MKTQKIQMARIINLIFRGFFLFAALTSLAILFPLKAHALTPVTVAWDANNPVPDGYIIYWGTSSGNLTNSHDAGDATQYTIPDLTEGDTYYFAATAYEDDNGVRNESAYSEELSHTIAPLNSNPTTPSAPSGPTSGFLQTTYSFSANASDPDDDQLEYEFDWGDGVISNWGNSTQSHTWLSIGNYCVSVRARDVHGATSDWSNCGSITIILNTHTIAASAGTHGNIFPSGSVTVNNGADQSFSISPDQYYRVADLVVDGSSVGSVTTYTFDNIDRDHTIVASFVVDNQPPVSNAGADQTVLVNDTVQLDGSGSSDADGDSAIFNWSFVSRPNGSSATLSDTNIVNPSFEVDVAGTYTVQLIVNDGTVNSAPDTVTISTENSAPVANAGADQTILVSDTVQLDGSGSSDADGDSVIFNWSLVSRPNGSSATLSDTNIVNPSFEVDVAGTYAVQLIVNDGTVNSAPDTVTISTENSAPVANAGADQTILVSDTVQLDGSGSSDADGDSAIFNWSLVSRPNGSSATLSDTNIVNPGFEVDVAGTYTVQLIVNDGTVNSAPDTVTISTENSAPVANAGADQTILVSDTVQLDGSGSSDADGDSAIFNWSFVSRPNGSDATLSNTGIVNPSFEVDVAGTYAVQLIVNDGTVNSAPDTVTISTENSAPVVDAAPSGPTSGFLQTDYSFSTSASDADEDELEYKFDWGDGSESSWGISSLSHLWSDTGDFCVKTRARDTQGALSQWSNCHTISISENTHTISASAGTHGSINPSGSVLVNNGDPQTFSITAAQDYQILEVRVDGTLIGTATSYTFNNVVQDHTITASFVYVDPNPVDSDGDGVPDSQDAFPQDPSETTDTDNDGYGNNFDDDDDGDQMPDAWEIENDLDPLVNDAALDPDGDGATNFEEYEAGTGANFFEDHFPPEAPGILTPLDNELVSLTPELTTDEYYDPDIDDVHAESRWQIFRADDNFCVLDVTSHSAFTSLKVPKLILEEDTDYIWQVRFINNHATESDWSAVGSFTTDLIDDDPNGNGIPDSQEVAVDLDLDNDGVVDSDQDDIKCVDSPAEDVQIGVSIKDSDNVASIVSMEIENAGEALPILESIGIPKFFQFGLIDFKILTHAPGDETVVTIHLSKAAVDQGKLYKYDPINAEWVDYSDYAEFSADRRVIYLTLRDGGFGDADGIENGIIVDPLTVGTDDAVYDGGSGSDSDSAIEDFFERIIPNVGCFISTAVQSPAGGLNIWSEIRGRELAILFILILLAYVGKIVCDRKKI